EIENHEFVYGDERIKRTVSCGVAAWPHPRISSRDEIIKAADDALYVAKERGRDRVVRFDSEEFKAHSKPPEPAHSGLAASVQTGS
ncbi:MAG: diguanylate cyclase, partial [Gemmatimonadaceae bacterium]|nr:diguanylate cyclase [Gemmatimonadaceae bacterium]